jgi:hypothetical protein
LFALHRPVPGRDHERIPVEYCFSSRESLQSAQQERSWKHSDSVMWH